MRVDRRRLFELERALLLRDKAFKDEYIREKTFMEEMQK
jgi:hypothetical protein